MKVLKDCSQILTLKKAYEKKGRNLLPEDLSVENKKSIVFNDSEILWIGDFREIPQEYDSAEIINAQNLTITPEIVDSHTHLVFGGDRSSEYAMRLNGADYQAIAASGGGILASMKGTNQSSLDDLFKEASQRIERIHSYGIGTIEIKSGYGLNYEREKEISFLIDRLKKAFSPKVQIINTFMAAHAIPKEYKSGNEYLKSVCLPLLEELSSENIIDIVDIFHEEGYFSYQDVEVLFNKSKELGIPVKSHADEFQDNKGASLGVKYKAISVDHLLATSNEGIQELAKSQTVATLLPGTGFFLGKAQAKARDFLDAGCQVAIASDYNPGSCHCDNLLLIASISAPQYKLNQCELWSAITLNAAHALNLRSQGAILEGLAPRFSYFETQSIDMITYSWGKNLSVWPSFLR